VLAQSAIVIHRIASAEAHPTSFFAMRVESSTSGGVWFGHLLEISMSLNPVALNVVDACAIRTVVVRGQQVAAAGYYFGYWFSHRRA